MINPYSNVNWATTDSIVSCSHMHLNQQDWFENAYGQGVRHFAISNYYPSAPSYPLSSIYDNVPIDAVSCPNAEHHSFTDSNLHMCAIGSTYNSMDGVEKAWSVGMAEALDGMIYPNGGGFTINHPHWSTLKPIDIIKMLDFNPFVLGIEIYNDSTEINYTPPKGWALDYWDEILRTGRRCWGFCVPDHEAKSGTFKGRNILLVPELTEQACAEAYYNGAFYGVLNGSGLSFTEITATQQNVIVKTNGATSIIATNNLGSKIYNANEIIVSLDATVNYIRFEAVDDSGERIFSQPIILRDYVTLNRKKRAKRVIAGKR